MPLLHWLTRDADIHAATHAPYRLLEEVSGLSHGDRDTGNMLIQGDNLDALKALLPYYASKVKCIFIDPPYNTRSAFEHYDDNLEHTKWLAMMYPRLELLRSFLSEEGSIWVTIDDNEAHYLKVIMDEVFGRRNFVANVVWQKAYGPRSNAFLMSDSHDHVFVYGKSKQNLKFGLLTRSEEQTAKYRNTDNDPRGLWKPENSSISLLSGQRGKQFAKTGVSENIFEIVSPTGKKHLPPQNRCWAFSPKKYAELLADNRIWFGEDGNGRPSIKRFLIEISAGVIPQTVWTHQEVGHNQDASREIRELFGDSPFSTPKPERLIQRILHIATNPDDIVLDSFLGSGTTCAVAHKMHRRYIGIEMGDHAQTHCAQRLQKVIEGEQGGISEAVGWTGGGGFRFYRLGNPVFDEAGHIAKGIRFAPLAAHLWFLETGFPFSDDAASPLLGIHDETAYYLLYNGILGDKRANSGNVLTSKTIVLLPRFDGQKIIFGEACRLSDERLLKEKIIFRHIPYEIKAR